MYDGTLRIKPPLRGVHRSADLQTQPEHTCYDARDVLPFDAATGRARLAVRPGWDEYGEQDNVNLITTLHVTSTSSHSRLLITASGGTLWKWSGETPTSLGSGITTGRHVQAAPYLQDLFIANDSTPKVYKHAGPSLGNWTASTDGTVPSGCPLICEWANRIVLAGNPVHVWYMSRVGDPYSWLFGADDASSPVAATDIEGGQIGEPLTALIPHNRDCLLISSANTIAVVRGNPTDGGIFERVSNVTGITNSAAWCRTPSEITYMMTRRGLAMMPPGCGDYPTLVSEDVIPESLTAIDGINRQAYLSYDVLNGLVHIHVNGESPEYWFYDTRFEGFWPATPPGTSILAMHRHDPIEDADASGVLVGTASGLYRLDRTVPLGGASPAYAKLGPFPLTDSLSAKALVQKARVKFGSNTTDDAEVGFYAAEDGETVSNLPTGRRSLMTAGTFAGGHARHPRVAGQSGVMTITQDDTDEHWSFEEASWYTRTFGTERGA